MEAPLGGYIPPEEGVMLILNELVLSHEPASPTVRPQIQALSKFHASRKGRIKVNKEVGGRFLMHLTASTQLHAIPEGTPRHYCCPVRCWLY